MKKGIVMEVNERFLTLLTPEGEFLRAAKQNDLYNIGQEIHFFPIEVGNQKKRSFFSFVPIRNWKTYAAAAAILLLALIFIPIYQNNQVYAYMSIDINPSIEIGLNKDFEVIELTSFNKEGKAIIAQLGDWQKQDFDRVSEQILAEIKQDGYLKRKNKILIATVFPGEREKSLDKRINQEIRQMKNYIKKNKIEFTILNGSAKERESALKKGMTTGSFIEKQNEASKKPKANNQEDESKARDPEQESKANHEADESKVKRSKIDEMNGKAKKRNADRLDNVQPAGIVKKVKQPIAANKNLKEVKGTAVKTPKKAVISKPNIQEPEKSIPVEPIKPGTKKILLGKAKNPENEKKDILPKLPISLNKEKKETRPKSPINPKKEKKEILPKLPIIPDNQKTQPEQPKSDTDNEKNTKGKTGGSGDLPKLNPPLNIPSEDATDNGLKDTIEQQLDKTVESVKEINIFP